MMIATCFRAPTSVLRALIFILLPFCCLLLLAASLLCIHINSPQYLTIDSGPVKADVMVVLGGEVDRAARAAELFKSGEAPQVLVSGTGDWAINRKFLLQHEVPSNRILTEDKSSTTRDNARFSVPILRKMGAKRVIIVTSWYHSRRALACFRHEATDIQFFSRPSYVWYPGKGTPSKYVEAAQRVEVAKLFGYALRYGIWAFWEN